MTNFAAALYLILAACIAIAAAVSLIAVARDVIVAARRSRRVAAFRASPEYVAARDATRAAYAYAHSRRINGHARSADMQAYRAARAVWERMDRQAERIA